MPDCQPCFNGGVRSNRLHAILRHRVTGQTRMAGGHDCENGMWQLVRAGGRDLLADYEEEEATLLLVSKTRKSGKKGQNRPAH